MPADNPEKTNMTPAPASDCEVKELNDPALAEVLDKLDPQQKQIIIRSIQSISQESFSGPIPHPDILMGYDKVGKGFADRIIRMAEKEQESRHECNSALVKGPIKATARGQWMGFIIAILFLGAAVYLASIGQSWLAGILGGGTLVSLVTVFVTNKTTVKKESEQQPQDTDN